MNSLYEINVLVKERCNSIALAMELHLSCTNPSKLELCKNAHCMTAHLKLVIDNIFVESIGSKIDPEQVIMTSFYWQNSSNIRFTVVTNLEWNDKR